MTHDIMLTPRWLDQPDFECFEAITELNLPNAMMVQVAKVTYQGGRGYMVTTGNLFGSQTILVPNADEALLALNVLQHQSRKIEEASKRNKDPEPMSIKNYPSWKLLPNKGEENGTKEEGCGRPDCECAHNKR